MLITYLALTLAKTMAEPFCIVIEEIRDMAEEACWGEDKIKQYLLELQMRLDLEEITQEEYMVAEDVLMERLEEGRRRRGEGG